MKKVKGHYYVSLEGGLCSVRKFANIRQARATVLSESGTDNFQYVRPATEEDIAWHIGMGGRIW